MFKVKSIVNHFQLQQRIYDFQGTNNKPISIHAISELQNYKVNQTI